MDLSALRERLPASVKDRLRPLARRFGHASPIESWWQSDRAPWQSATPRDLEGGVWCNICGGSWAAFLGPHHTEAATCPRCGAIARDRFLWWCGVTRNDRLRRRGARILETSPRLGGDYRAMMRRFYDYRASDFDGGAHRADLEIDLQDIALPAGSLDVILTPHVLEHVPDTDRALAQLYRVLAPGGAMYLQVPICYGRTAAPATPEFHADNTPVFWNFGWDLTDRLRSAGFDATVLVTDAYARILRREVVTPDPGGDGFHLDELVAHARGEDLTPIADAETSRRLGFLPSHHFATWECVRPRWR